MLTVVLLINRAYITLFFIWSSYFWGQSQTQPCDIWRKNLLIRSMQLLAPNIFSLKNGLINRNELCVSKRWLVFHLLFKWPQFDHNCGSQVWKVTIFCDPLTECTLVWYVWIRWFFRSLEFTVTRPFHYVLLKCKFFKFDKKWNVDMIMLSFVVKSFEIY